jgi:hypothetical protein
MVSGTTRGAIQDGGGGALPPFAAVRSGRCRAMVVVEGGLAPDLSGGGRRVVGYYAWIRHRPGQIRSWWQRWSRGR